MDKQKRFNEIAKGIKLIKIQGARNIAKQAIYAYNLVQHRPTEKERDSYARNYKSPEGIGEHELFHNLGLSHLEVTKEIKTEADRENVMYSHREWDAQRITKAQIENVYKEYSKGSLNKYDK